MKESIEEKNIESKEELEEKNEHCETDCCCGCHEGHHHDDDDDEEDEPETPLGNLIAALVLFAAGLVIEHVPLFKGLFGSIQLGNYSLHRVVFLALYCVAYILCGKDVLKSAVRNISRGKIFDEQFLMAVASIGAIFVGEIAEAVAVMLFYGIGEFFQDYAVDRSRDSITALMDIRPDKAFVLRDGKTVEVKPEDVKPGEIIEVKPGERVALDGVILSGTSFMDTSALTGESVPRKVFAGSDILAGFVNQNSVVQIKVTKSYGESAVTRILELTQKASAVKARSEKFITRFAKVYTPVVCYSALAVAVLPSLFLKFFMPGLFVQYGWHTWIYRALTFLVVSCPCALVISVPLSFFSGIGTSSKYGILVKGSNYIENLAKVDTAVFDKTGTLTKGIFAVSRVFAEAGVDEDELVAVAAHAEYFSNHPISKSIKMAHVSRTGGATSEYSCPCCEKVVKTEAEEIAGHGVKINLDGKTVLAGNEKLMALHGVKMADGSQWKVPEKITSEKLAGTVIHIAAEGIYKGSIVISDEVKEDSLDAIRALKKAGVKNTVMLTGDNEETAAIIAEDLGLDKVYANLLPQDKVSKVEELISEAKKAAGKKRPGSLIFVGDGVNDSPVLARADVGVAMGALGSDAAIEAADVVIMDDKPSRLLDAIRVSRGTMSVVNQNIWGSIAIKVAIMVLSAVGLGNMWIAVFGDVGVCFLAILNSMRILRK